MRKSVAIAGHSAEGLALIPLLEANPEIEVCAIYSPRPQEAREALARLGRRHAEALAPRITADARSVLAIPGLVALIDAELPVEERGILQQAPECGVQVTTPLIARLLFAFGPVDGAHRADLLGALAEILDSYHLMIDRRALQERALQVAVAATGADRGSLMLWDPREQCLRVAVALGMDHEVIAKVRVQSGEGISGRAWAEGRALSLSGRADHEEYRIARARRDVAAALSVPLEHEGVRLGVLNLSHTTDPAAFDADDLEFAGQLARIEAGIIARADAHQRLVNDAARLRIEAELRAIFAASHPPAEQLARATRRLASELGGGLCQLHLLDREQSELWLRASSAGECAPPRSGLAPHHGLFGEALRGHAPLVLSASAGGERAVHARLPLRVRDGLLGLLSFEGLLRESDAEALPERFQALGDALAATLDDVLRDEDHQRDLERAALLAAASVQLARAPDPTPLARVAATCAADLLEAEHALLRLADPGGRLRVRAYSGRATADEEPDLFELECGLAEEALRRGGPLRRTDLSAHPFPDPEARPRCAIVVPLRSGEQVLGTLSVLGRRSGLRLLGDVFDPNDEAAAVRLAGHVQIALEALGERQRSQAQQRSDPLTGLANVAALEERIAAEISRSRGRGHRLCLIQVHMPLLKPITESLPPESGEALLTSLAHAIRGAVRDFDLVARVEPDTFAVLAPEPDVEASALISLLTRRLRSVVAEEVGPEKALGLPLEFGYALFPDDASDADSLRGIAQRTRIRAL